MKPYYQDANCEIYLGDNRVLLPAMPDCDLLLTDPPYGIKVAKHGTIGSQAKRGHKRTGFAASAKLTEFGKVKWDDTIPPRWVLDAAMEKTRWQIIWGGGHMGHMPRATCWLVWDKRNDGVDFSNCEIAWTNLKRAVRIFRWRWNGCLQEDMKNKEKRVHPAQKPVPLMDWCLTMAHTNGTVIDPWMGAGSTLVAAKRAGLKAIGIEREEIYCELAAKRLRETPESPATFAATGNTAGQPTPGKKGKTQ